MSLSISVSLSSIKSLLFSVLEGTVQYGTVDAVDTEIEVKYSIPGNVINTKKGGYSSW